MHAACRHVDPELFFPEGTATRSPSWLSYLAGTAFTASTSTLACHWGQHDSSSCTRSIALPYPLDRYETFSQKSTTMKMFGGDLTVTSVGALIVVEPIQNRLVR